MKIHELIKLLQEQNQDVEVLVSIDPEGNRFNHIDETIFVGDYEIKYDEINIGYKELANELVKQGYTDEDLITKGQPCIVLYPV